MSRRHPILGLALLPAAWFFFDDATTNALHPINPALGRLVPACYTKVEDWLGLSQPSSIRLVEFAMGLGLFAVVARAWQLHRLIPDFLGRDSEQ